MESDIIKISHLHKSFGEVKAVNDLSFRVKKGELFAFLGVNGAGKSTTISILCGLLKKDSGTVQVNGIETDKAGEMCIRDRSKEVLLLYGYVGYNVRDIAKYLKITEATAYKRLQRARSALAEKIGIRQGNDRNAASRNSMRCDG